MYTIEGEIVHGDEIGRTLGFPTANIHMYDDTVPDGVWAARVAFRDGRTHPAVVSVGRRPTFFESDAVRLLEAHIIEFEGSIYGEWIVVELLDYIRPQERFESIRELMSAMRTDLKKAAAITSQTVAGGRQSGGSAAARETKAPKWALRRVRTASAGNAAAHEANADTGPATSRTQVTNLSRQLGMSRGLVRRCLRELEDAEVLTS
ncbi:riboflavin kinase [Brevibacterium sp. UCMA 11754]|uniref:riboflavin kinase n=1 Tax=Brevibacterium sp. UCMA 11754 TaxID=2749198 RepID=UPI001F1936B7|nr:riboflavin kinase [Brevibacterium sp. UCMA 11754]MCF2570781.1 riboflavin kinase [Brevibacterium sp. UCMA 11754]